MSFPRSSGILLHPTSLPGRFGIGDLGEQAYRFVDFLTETKQQLWQILPLGPTGYGNSPYLCYSSLAGNPLLINLDRLHDQGLLTEEELAEVPLFPTDHVDYSWVYYYKLDMLRKAAQRFKENTNEELLNEFAEFCQNHGAWLDDYALFMAIKDAKGNASWTQWESDIARREPAALERWRVEVSPSIFWHKFMQFEFGRQWFALKAYANQNGISIVGDMPIYVAHDSADVWAFPENFMIDPESLNPSLMAGVPPDYFSETGQLWGNPTYNWETFQD
ncbi:MAG: 4-alpha-glucanotransferase, partial [Cyanobacteria bacterium P01_A01_bin.114]